MMGIEGLLYKFTGDNDALIMLGAFSLLVLLNFITEMYKEVHKKDLHLDDVIRFGRVIILNALFLLGLEIVMIPAARIPLAYDIFYTIQMSGWLGAMAYYFYGFYKNLRSLGLASNERLEEAFRKLNKQNDKEDEQ